MTSAVAPARRSSNTSVSPLLESNRFVAALLFAAVLIVFVMLQPFVEIPKNDDFAWARAAEALARTGRITYNGWGNPILLPHTVAGASVIRLFGFSYAALSLFGAVSGAAFAAASYLLARKCNVSRFASLVLVAILTLNPVFLGVAPSFMSDVPTAFLAVAALLAFAHALTPAQDPQQKLFDLRPTPFAVAVVLAFLAGANRQLFWAVFLCAFASAWKNLTPASRKRYLLPALLLTLLGAVAVSKWFALQPYSVSLSFVRAISLLRSNQAGLAFLYPYKLVNIVGLALLPLALPAVISGAVAMEKPVLRRFLATLVSCVTLSLAVLGVCYLVAVGDDSMRSGIYGIREGGQYLTSRGIELGGMSGWYLRPVVLPMWVSHLLYGLGAVGIGLFGFLLLPSRLTGRKAVPLSPLATVVIRAALVTALVQIVLPLPWYAGGSCFDRYVLGILPGLLLFCAVQLPEQVSVRYPVMLFSVILCGAYAVGGVGMAQEYFASLQCKHLVLAQLRERGIPREQIDGGWDIDGETQILAEGYINNPGQPYYDPTRQGNCSTTPHLCPAVDAFLLLSYSPSAPDLSGVYSRNALRVNPEPVLVTEYASLLPPFTRRIYLYRLQKGEPRRLKLVF